MFLPWVGKAYENGIDGKRVLVVGESHYSDIHETRKPVPDMTVSVMTEYMAGIRKNHTRTLDNLAWAVSGKGPYELRNEGKRGEFEIWQQLGFYNYIPVVLTDGPQRDRPDKDLFISGKEPFENVLQNNKPDILIVCGLELFPWLIMNHYPEFKDPWSFRGDWIDFPRNNPIRAVRIKHPSKFFSHSKWHLVIDRAITSYETSVDV